MSDVFVYLEKKEGSEIFRCRGAISASEGIKSFGKKMLLSGLKSFTSPTHLGREVERHLDKDGKTNTYVALEV